MRSIFIVLAFFLSISAANSTDNEKEIRYILIEAPCKPGFNALKDYTEKVIVTKIFKAEFENAFEMVNAESDLIVDFEVALEKEYPNSRNQVKDILVYMLNTEKDAKELYNRKLKQFKTLNTGVIQLKVK